MGCYSGNVSIVSDMSASAEFLLKLERFDDLIANAIESSDWEQLHKVLIDRQALLEQLCALTLQDHERERVINRMVSIQDADRDFMAAVHTQKQALQKQAASLAHDRKAIQAYQSD